MAFHDAKSLHQAFDWLGQELGKGPPLEISVIGGAAGHLLGQFPLKYVTDDVDAVYVRPWGAVDEILGAAEKVSHNRLLPGGWLNQTDAGLYAQTIPEGWETRRVLVGDFGRLKVFAISRQDLIAMKFLAHRQQDMEHLTVLHVTAKDLEFTTAYLAEIAEKMPDERNAVEKANYLVANWRSVHE